MLADIYRGFAHPGVGLDEETIGVIAVEHAREVVRRFLVKYGDALDRSSAGLIARLEAWLEEEASLSTVWDPSFSMLDHLLGDGASLDPLSYAAELCLGVPPAGEERWSFRLAAPARLRLDRWVLPCSLAGSVSGAGDVRHLTLEGDGARHDLTFVRSGGVWHAAGAPAGLIELPTLALGRHRMTFFDDVALDGRDDGIVPLPPVWADAEIVGHWRAAIDLLDRYAPEYVPWVGRGIRFVIPVLAPDGAMVSGSQGHRHGEVHLASLLPPIKAAEMLVHEASHQHFFLATKLGWVDDGSDTGMYYSPVVREMRPVWKILLAYHAFANVVVYYRLCRAAGLTDDGFSERNEERVLDELAQLEAPLSGNGALSELGRGLWEPLAERLAATAVLR